MRSRSEILADLGVIDKRESELMEQHRIILSSLTGPTGTIIAGVLTAAGVAASWATFGVSIALSILGGLWFAKETVDKTKARSQIAAINDELMSLGERRRALQAALVTAPRP